MTILPTIFDPSRVIAAQSTRLGGVSPAPYASLNLGMSVGDQEKNVLRNRELFFSALGIPLSRLSKGHQVHGNKVAIVKGPGEHSGFDAQVTNTRNVFLVVSIADCTPILLHDEKNDVVAAIHAGWRGTAAGIVTNTLRLMKENFLTEGKNCKAFIGACISCPNFEVGAEVASHFSPAHKHFDDTKGKWFVDLKAANRQQLLDAGLKAENIEVSALCTVSDNDRLFSHRKEKGLTGRMMAVIGMK